MSAIERIDAHQRQHSWLGLPLAVIYKFFDDRGPYLAAQITYYGFVSLFPLLLLFFSALGFFLESDPALRNRLVGSALQNFPVIGPQLRHNIGGFRGSGLGLAVGIGGTLYGGLGVMQAAQAAFNQVYAVPRNEQPNPLTSRLRSLALLALLGGGVLLSTGASAMLATANGLSRGLGPTLHALGYVVTFMINAALFTGAFQLLTARDLRVRRVITGGLIAAGVWLLLQTEGTRLLSARLAHAGEVYGTFALVLGAIAWIYLESLALVLAAEINVVLHRRLWPRALLTPFTDDVELTDADRRVYRLAARAQRFKGFQEIEVRFDGEEADEPGWERDPAPGPRDGRLTSAPSGNPE